MSLLDKAHANLPPPPAVASAAPAAVNSRAASSSNSKQDTNLPQVTSDMEEQINKAFKSRDSETLVEANGFKIIRNDIESSMVRIGSTTE